MSPKRWLQFVVSLAVSAALVWYAARGVELGRVAEAMRTADYRWAVPAVLITIALQYVRVWRFGYLIAPFVSKVPFSALFRIGNIGMFAIFVMPVRLGEFVRPYLLKREFNASLTASLGAVAAERVIDGLVVTLGFFLLTTLGLQVSPAMQRAGLMAFLIFFAAGLALAIVLVGHERGAGLLRRLVAIVSPRLADRLVGAIVKFASGLRALTHARAALSYLFWTLTFWLTSGIANAVLFYAMHIALPIRAGYLVQALTVIAVMVPAGPGFIGAIQWAIVWGLTMFGVDQNLALAYSILLHAIAAAVTIGFGLWSLLTSHLSIGRLVKESQEEVGGAV